MAQSGSKTAEPFPQKAEVIGIIQGGIDRRRPPQKPFAIKSGTSWVYVDAKQAVRHGRDLTIIARYAVAQIQISELACTAVGGLTMGATPFASSISIEGGYGRFEVCKAEDPYERYAQGERQRTPGARFVPGDRLWVAEDVTSTGGSALAAVDTIRDVCAEQEVEDVGVVGIITMLDRGRLAAQRFADAGISFLALTSYADVGLEPLN